MRNDIFPRRVVYRVDTRHISDIMEAGGFYPNTSRERPSIDYNLVHHFDTEMLDGYASGLISTTYGISEAIEHIRYIAREIDDDNNDYIPNDFVGYIYAIVPNENFYDLSLSLVHARNQLPETSSMRNVYNRLLVSYGTMQELVALESISTDRIISYIEITGEVLNGRLHTGGFLFWENHDNWINNQRFNQRYANDHSNINPYPCMYNNIEDFHRPITNISLQDSTTTMVNTTYVPHLLQLIRL